jgi:hypothetical protein
MNSILATEAATAATVEKSSTLAPLESWAANERMRHVPTAEWMARKVDNDLRRRIEKLKASFSNLSSGDPRYPGVDNAFRGLCKALERLCEAAKARHNGTNHHNSDVHSRLETLLANSVAALRALEPTAFGRRYPYHFFDKSKAEPVYGALLAVIDHAEKVLTLVRTIDPDIDERLLESATAP